jgi:GR25 family glycosyltransferase involved in LPS biosynthesis
MYDALLKSLIPGDHASHDPLLCATEDNSVGTYRPDLPEWEYLTPVRIACWYSHLSVIESIANDESLAENDAAIVLEDDVDMERDIHTRLQHVWPQLPNDWDIVFLGE